MSARKRRDSCSSPEQFEGVAAVGESNHPDVSQADAPGRHQSTKRHNHGAQDLKAHGRRISQAVAHRVMGHVMMRHSMRDLQEECSHDKDEA